VKKEIVMNDSSNIYSMEEFLKEDWYGRTLIQIGLPEPRQIDVEPFRLFHIYYQNSFISEESGFRIITQVDDKKLLQQSFSSTECFKKNVEKFIILKELFEKVLIPLITEYDLIKNDLLVRLK
jgi:hypothetical protein